MKKKICTIAIILVTTISLSQNWTDPVNISNMNDFILKSDFTIDNEGVIHCIWNLKFNSNYAAIFYSKSEDDGYIWTEPISISQNDTHYCTNPQIAHDSENNLYVGYDLNIYTHPDWGSYTYFVKYDSAGWGEPLYLSEGIATRLVADHNDRVYVFWHTGAPHKADFSYQYLDEDEWSEIYCPYDNDNMTFLNKVVADDKNNLHCAGMYDPEGGPLESRMIYFSYDYENELWSELTFPSDGTPVRYNDIVLDTNQLPHICWEEGATYYSFFDETQWSEKEVVASANTYRVVIEVDNTNKVHIAATEETEDHMNLVYYHRPFQSNWENMVVDQCNNTIFTPEFEMYNNQLYLVYKMSNVPGFGDVYLTKLNLVTGMIDRFIPGVIQNEICTYPNPFSRNTLINFTIRQAGYLKMCIYDIYGQPVTILIDRWHEKGEYNIQWDGTNQQGNEVPAGSYLLIILNYNQQITNKLQYLPKTQ